MAISRRPVLLGATAALCTPFICRGQGLRKVRFTMPWVAQGSTLYIQVAQQKGFWKKRGLDVDVARGYGSVAVAQAIGGNKFDFGVVQSPSVVLAAAKGLPITVLAFTSYTGNWAVALRDDSPIRGPKDLVGKKVGGVPASGDYPMLPLYLKRAGVDPASVDMVSLDSKILEQSVIQKQVDGASSVVSSTAPLMISQKVPSRFLQYRDYDVDAYGLSLAAYRPHLQDVDLCRDVTDGLMEGVAYTLTNPDEGLKIFYSMVPEIAITQEGRFYSEIGLAMLGVLINDEVSRTSGLGAADPAKVVAMIDLIVDNLAPPGTPKPTLAEVFDGRFAGKPTLSAAQWADVVKLAAPYAPYFQTNGKLA